MWKLYLIFIFILTTFFSFSQDIPNITFDPTSGNYILKYFGVAGDTIEVVFVPATKIEPQINSSVTYDEKYIYEYSVNNSVNSNQRLIDISIEYYSAFSNVKSPNNTWRKGKFSFAPIINWYNSKSSSGVKLANNGIAPDSSVSGFSFESYGLPSIVNSYFQGATPSLFFPEEPPDSVNQLLDPYIKFPNNTIIKKTVSPKDPPAEFNAFEFADSVISYINQSYALGWIFDEETEDKYLDYFHTVKFIINEEDYEGAIEKLEEIMIVAEEDLVNEPSSGGINEEPQEGGYISTESFALIYYNSEFFIKKLEEY